MVRTAVIRGAAVRMMRSGAFLLILVRGSGAMGKYFGRCFGVTPLSTRNVPATIAASHRVRVPPGAEANRPTIDKEARTYDEPSFSVVRRVAAIRLPGATLMLVPSSASAATGPAPR
jgi:hypothetical protein